MKINRLSLLSALAAGLAVVALPVQALELEEETQEALGIEVAAPAAFKLAPEVAAQGTVLAPAALVDLFRQIAAARAALEISKESLARAEKLFAGGELVARKDVQAAQTQQAQDEAKLSGLDDRLALEWGPHFAAMAADARAALLAQLLVGKQALIRFSAARDAPLGTGPQGARLHPLGQETALFHSTAVFAAPTVDPASQAQAFLAVVATPQQPLATGLALAGVMELAGAPQSGVCVPQAAVVFYLGKAWVYQKTDDTHFERIEISTTTSITGGWFVAGEALATKQLVTTGCQTLLSKETLKEAEEE